MRSKLNMFDKIIETSNEIEKLYEELKNAEIEYGEDSNEYIMLSKIIGAASLTELNEMNKILLLSNINVFKKYVSLFKCNRLIDKLNYDSELTKKMIIENANTNYEKEKDLIKNKISKEEYLKEEYEELGRHKLSQNIFNLIQAKSYIKVIDLYIDKEQDPPTKKMLIDKKYDIISKNNSLESWYFNFNYNNDCLLVESDALMSLELGFTQDEYVKLKNNYYMNVVSNLVDSNSLENNKLSEINIIATLLCMNSASIVNSFYEIKDGIKNNYLIDDVKTMNFIDNIYSKYPTVEKKLRLKCANKEEI